MKHFDHFELDPNNGRILACGIDECGQAHKTPIFWLSRIDVDGNRVVVFDNNKPMFVLETKSNDEALQKKRDLCAFLNEHLQSLSFFMP